MSSAQPSASPRGPCFVSSRKGCFTFENAFEPTERCSLYAYVNGYCESLEVFDAGARRWRVAGVDTPHKTHFLARFLAHTVYNPTRKVRIRWASPTPYTIADLRETYLKAVELDDDILTQFVDRKELMPKIRAAPDFAAMIEVHRWASTDHD